MANLEIKYKGNTIASSDTSVVKTIKTAGKYCEDDIEVDYTAGGGGPTGYSLTIQSGSHKTTHATTLIIYADGTTYEGGNISVAATYSNVHMIAIGNGNDAQRLSCVSGSFNCIQGIAYNISTQPILTNVTSGDGIYLGRYAPVIVLTSDLTIRCEDWD